MSKLLILILISGLCYSYGQEYDEVIKKIGVNYCKPDLSAEMKAIVNDCEQLIPQIAKPIFENCAKENLGPDEGFGITLCYHTGPNAGKYSECVKVKEAEAVQQGIVFDDETKKDITEKYLNCLSKGL